MAVEHPVQTSEAGHQGHDRQPGKHPSTSASPTPPPGAATAAQVQRRSERPGEIPQEISPDMLHPGPDRLESEKSDVHPEPDATQEFKPL